MLEHFRVCIPSLHSVHAVHAEQTPSPATLLELQTCDSLMLQSMEERVRIVVPSTIKLQDDQLLQVHSSANGMSTARKNKATTPLQPFRHEVTPHPSTQRKQEQILGTLQANHHAVDDRATVQCSAVSRHTHAGTRCIRVPHARIHHRQEKARLADASKYATDLRRAGLL